MNHFISFPANYFTNFHKYTNTIFISIIINTYLFNKTRIDNM